MKQFKSTSIITGLFLIITASFAFSSYSMRPPKKTTIAFKVFGVCEMCKERIESALDRKGVYKAVYNYNSHMVTITYNPQIFTKEEQFHNIVAMAGHDTEVIKADNVVYSNLPDCCKYRDLEKE